MDTLIEYNNEHFIGSGKTTYIPKQIKFDKPIILCRKDDLKFYKSQTNVKENIILENEILQTKED